MCVIPGPFHDCIELIEAFAFGGSRVTCGPPQFYRQYLAHARQNARLHPLSDKFPAVEDEVC